MPRAKTKTNTSSLSIASLKTKFKKNPRARYVSLIVFIAALLILILPRLTVAIVDGKPITIFEYYKVLDSKYGKDTKEQLISEKLVEAEAAKRGIKVSDAEVDAQVKQIEQQASGSANLNQILAQQGLTNDEFRKQVRLQALIKKMFGNQASVSAGEVDKYIEKNRDQLGEINDSTRKNVEDQLKQQKLIQAFRTWLDSALHSKQVIRL